MPTPAPALAVVARTPAPPVVPIGRAVLEGIRDGRFDPPATATLLGLDLIDVGEGTTAFRFRPDARFDNGAGVSHGGILATVADFAVTTAVATVAPEGALASTAQLNVNYLRPVRTGGAPVLGTGRVVRAGRSVAHAEATITDADGRTCVTASAVIHLAGP